MLPTLIPFTLEPHTLCHCRSASQWCYQSHRPAQGAMSDASRAKRWACQFRLPLQVLWGTFSLPPPPMVCPSSTHERVCQPSPRHTNTKTHTRTHTDAHARTHTQTHTHTLPASQVTAVSAVGARDEFLWLPSLVLLCRPGAEAAQRTRLHWLLQCNITTRHRHFSHNHDEPSRPTFWLLRSSATHPPVCTVLRLFAAECSWGTSLEIVH